MIGFGATICLTLFSMITPLMNQIQLNSEKSNNNHDILNFYTLITEIKRNGNTASQFPGEELRINNSFSSAKSIQFSKTNNSTLLLTMELGHQEFIEIIAFDINITIRQRDPPGEFQYLRFSRPEESDTTIEINFNLFRWNNLLWFEF